MLRAAATSADITPIPGSVLQGHWSLNRSHSVLLPLKVSALVLEEGRGRLAILTVDALGVPREFTARLRAQITTDTGIPHQQIMVCASHTHCAPAMLPIMQMQPDEAFVRSVYQAAVECVTRACAELEPAQIGLGSGSAYFNVNRRPLPGATTMLPNDAAVIDHRARVLVIRSRDQRPVATLFHFVCHPVSRSGSEGWISSDYPGAARAQIESQIGGHAMFIPGCFANIRPRMVDAQNRFRSATAEELQQIGDELAASIVRTVRSTRCEESPTSLRGVEIPVVVPFAAPPSAELCRSELEDQTPIGVNLRAPWARHVLHLLKTQTFPAGEETSMQAFKIGPLLLIGIPGEPALEIGLAIERMVSRSREIADVWSVGYCNDMLGYLCTRRQYSEGGYETGAYVYFQRPAPFQNEEEALLQGTQALCSALWPPARNIG